MFDQEIVINDHELKLRIQSEIMHRLEDIKNTQDIGYTSWEVATDVVERIKTDKNYRHKSKKFLDIFEAKL